MLLHVVNDEICLIDALLTLCKLTDEFRSERHPFNASMNIQSIIRRG